MLTEDNRVKILRLFFEGPNVRLHLREVARRTGLSATGAMKILGALEKERLLEKKRTAFMVVYRGNYDNERFMALKRCLNLYSLYSCDLVSSLVEFYRIPECIILFGSYAKGEDTKESDIDIAIITGIKDYPELEIYEDCLKRKISLHLIENSKNEKKEFINSLANGIVLYGYMEVV
ncbi:MAG: nucleotidyltransferase domain-containing protein [Candidatus Methanoperedens sp.]|nr:nucleotidyltransferase domain-containing protein [Candidatus Methanoperedens sp.]